MYDAYGDLHEFSTDRLVEMVTCTVLDPNGGKPGREFINADDAEPCVEPGMAFTIDGALLRLSDRRLDEDVAILRRAWAEGKTVRICHTDPATMGAILAVAGNSVYGAHEAYVRLCKAKRPPDMGSWDEWCRIVLMELLYD